MVSRVTAIPVGLAYYRVAMLTAKGVLKSERDGWYFNCQKRVPKTILEYYSLYMIMMKYLWHLIYCNLKKTKVIKFNSEMRIIQLMFNAQNAPKTYFYNL